MSTEITFILEPDRGKLTTEVSGISTDVLTELRDYLGSSQNVNCGKPLQRDVVKSPASTDFTSDDDQSIWLYRIYHDSVVDGPGRRSVVQVAGCSIRCPGCYVPYTHDRDTGKLVSVSSVVTEVLSRSAEHDGVTILGGEPFDQAGAVAVLAGRLKSLGFHLVVYSGYTVESLIERKTPSIDYLLTNIDLLIEGQFIKELESNAAEYRGSMNQRIVFVGCTKV